MKIRTAIALTFLVATQFLSIPVTAKKPFVYGPCRTIDIFLAKELRKNGIYPVEVKYDDTRDHYANYPKNSTSILVAIIKSEDSMVLRNSIFLKRLYTKVYSACSEVAAINLGVEQSGNDLTVGRSITSAKPIFFSCIDDEVITRQIQSGISKKPQWGTRYCD